MDKIMTLNEYIESEGFSIFIISSLIFSFIIMLFILFASWHFIIVEVMVIYFLYIGYKSDLQRNLSSNKWRFLEYYETYKQEKLKENNKIKQLKKKYKVR